jgi:transposase InsO family protein
MIALEMVHEIKRMLAAGKHSQRQIARLTGISRATVGAIASGARPEYQPRPRDDEPERPTGPPSRCPTCGGRVFLPCRLCRIRAVKRRELERKKHLARFIGGNCRLR